MNLSVFLMNFLGLIAILSFFCYIIYTKKEKKEKKEREELNKIIEQQNKKTGFVLSHEYKNLFESANDCFISLSTREIITRSETGLFVNHFDSVDDVKIERKRYHSGAKDTYYITLKFIDCHKTVICVRDLDELVFWHNVFKRLLG